ncbi:MAG: cache domain-containing protein, partial [Halobacteria archaeon]|nr:cache domain-containing protein [Halobacteria archaeon]
MSFFLVLGLIGGIGGYMYLDSKATLTQDANQKIETTAELHSSQMESWITSSRQQARMISESEHVSTGDRQEVKTYIDGLVEDDETVQGTRAIHYIDTETTEILTSSLDGRIGGNPRQEGAPWAQEDLTQLETDEVKISAFKPEVANATVMTFVTPVPGGENRGIVLVTSISEVAKGLEQPVDSSGTKIVSSEGRVMLSQKNPNSVGTQNTEGKGVDSDAVASALDGNTGVIQADSGTVVMGYSPIESLNWAVVTHAPSSSLLSVQQSVSMGILGILVTAIVGMGLIGVTIGRNTLRSVKTLSSKAEEIEDGNLDTSLNSDRDDEIGGLFSSFDSMRSSLRKKINEAEEAKKEAERQRKESEEAKREAEEMRHHLEDKAQEYENVMSKVADGNLTLRMDSDSRNDAMNSIA